MAEVKITIESIDRNDVNLLLTMESGGFDYWCNIDYDRNDYKKAKAEMKEKGIKGTFGDEYCVEDIVAYMICDTPYKVYAYDFEEDEQYELTKENLLKGFQLNAQNRPHDMSLEDGDATTGDCILQYAIFGEVQYS